VLNSVNVSVTVLGERIQKSKIASVSKVAELLGQHAAAFARDDVDPKLQKIPEYLPLLAESLIAERGEMGEEISNLREKVQHIKNIINAQQNYTRRVAFKETIDVRHVIEDLLSIHGPAITKQQVRVDCDFAELPPTSVEKSKLLQVLDNLIKNAVESMATVERSDHVLTLRSRREEDRAVITVTDTGHGIDEERLKNIFRFGFTTKSNGNGFGLHSAAIAMSEMGGSIAVASDGPNRGATFTVVLPLTAEAEAEKPETPPQADEAALLNTV
jgi:C4-dicarboxylate-specific signal transduction histidine kinase